MNKFVAKYYKNDGQIVIYNSSICKLVEFPYKDYWIWNLSVLSKWEQTEFGCQIEFELKVCK